MKRLVSMARFSPALGCACALLVLLGTAFRSAWLATHDLQWPYDFDLFRDAAFAQAIIHGHFPADAYYADEQNWYNPLGAAVIAGIAQLFGIEPIDIYARYGAIVALAVPVAVFGLAVSLFGRWAGLASLFAFLFLGPHEVPSWAAPSYSPWLFANLLSLLPFALAVAVALRARESGRNRLWAACGALLGVTFLAHTAAAIVAGSVMLVLAWERRKLRTVAVRWHLRQVRLSWRRSFGITDSRSRIAPLWNSSRGKRICTSYPRCSWGR
jgi:4-amino-4-deoxy-L-arabinose transferase-like glycosyltransferase